MTLFRPAPRPGRPAIESGARRPRRIGGALLAGLLVLAGSLPAATSAAPRPTGASADVPTPIAATSETTPPTTLAADQPETGLLPGVHYEDAMAHADDVVAFVAGDAVTVGFRPRADDTWSVGGRAPRALPSGSRSGRELLAEATGAGPVAPAAETPAAEPTPTATPGPVVESPVDAPIGDPSAAPEADLTVAALPAAEDGLSLDGTRLRRQVFGFLPYWEVASASLDYETLSTIAYFSVGADKNGNLLKTNSDGSTTTGWSGWTSSKLTSIINAAHTKGTRVVLTVSMFAWTTGQAATQGAFLGNPTARLNLAQQAAAAVRARGADGINLDFEPIATGYADEYAAFIRTVRAELDKQAAGYQLTFDTTGYIGNYPLEAATAPGAADAVFVMGYDYRTAGSAYAGSIDPLAGPGYDLADTIAAYSARVPASKIILGVPWYGRAWSTVSDAVNAKTQSGTKYGTSSSVVYDTAADYAAQHGTRWDSRELTSWVAYVRENCTTTYGCVKSWRQIYFDDATSLKLRYDLVNRTGLRGVGIWALGYDGGRAEMRQALAEKFLNDKTAPLAGIRALAPVQGSETFTVSWTGTDESGMKSYDVQVSIDGGPFHDWLVGTTAGSASYVGADGHGFAFRVRGRDSHGNAGAWDVSSVYRPSVSLGAGGFAKIVGGTVNVRSAPDTSASIVTTAANGTVAAITGGPVTADGWTWWKVTLPIAEWSPVAGVRTDVWIASGNATTTLMAPVGAPNATVVDLAAGVTPAAGARFVGLTPTRLLDSRSGNGLAGVFSSGAARILTVAGRGGVPANAVAVSGTVTLVGQTAAGYLSVGPSAATVARSSVLNVPRGDIRATGLNVKLGANGTIAIQWTGSGGSTAHVVFDVSGYYVPGTTGATFMPLNPARLLDTRTGNGLAGAFVPSTSRALQVTGRGGVPAGAVAITANLTAVAPTSAGYLAAGPVATATPSTSLLNVPRGDNRAASATLKLDANGRLNVVWKGAPGSRVHVVVDVTGYFVNSAAGATYYPLDPARVLDTRTPNGLAGPFVRNVARSFQATGRGTIPVDAVAVSGTVTVVRPATAAFLTAGPTTGTLASTSTLNLPKGDIRANGLTVRTSTGGGLAGMLSGPAGASGNVVLDLSGYYR